ncbi:hypothetical protein D9M68_925180 [compost metagenome]
MALLLLLLERLLNSLKLFREPAALAFQLLDAAFSLPSLVLVVEPLTCQLLALLGHGGLRVLL